MFATSQSDKTKAGQVSRSVRDALEHGQMSAAIASVLRHGTPGPGEAGRFDSRHMKQGAAPPAEAPRPDLAQSMETLNRKLEPELQAGKMRIRLEARGLVVSLREAAFFASGDDTLNPASYPILEKVAEVVKALPNQLRLEGHTDAVPIHTPRFRSNWELSAARSIAMLELLGGRYGVPHERMAVAGYAENAPTDTNDTEEGRAHNRRVDLVVLAKEGLRAEPQASPPAAAN